jgi:hypothetical protein
MDHFSASLSSLNAGAPGSTLSSGNSQVGCTNNPTRLEREHEKVLTEIEQTELSDLIGVSLRTVYELDGQNSTDNQENFTQKLENRISQLDYDIELMCNYRYQGFLDALNDLSSLSTQTGQLFKQVSRANDEVQDLGAQIAEQRRESIAIRSKQSNIAQVCSTVSCCLPLFEAYNRLETQMQEERFHAALKTVEQIEHVLLPAVKDAYQDENLGNNNNANSDNSPLNDSLSCPTSPTSQHSPQRQQQSQKTNFSFTQTIEKQVPFIRTRVKKQAGNTLKNFLELISTSAEKIGEIVLARHLQQRQFKEAFREVQLPAVGDPPPLQIRKRRDTMDEPFDEFDNENNNNNIPQDEHTPFNNNASNPLQSSNSPQNKLKTKKTPTVVKPVRVF